MPFVSGFLRVRRRGHPDIGLPGPEGEVDPDYGIEEGGSVGGGPILPEGPEVDPPPGIWPPLTPENPWRPVDPGWGLRPGLPARPDQGLPGAGGLPPVPGQPLPRPPIAGGRPDQGLPGEGGGGEVAPPIALPPGMIWPPLPGGVSGKYLALVVVFGMKGGPQYRYTVIDADLRPGHGLPRPPISGGRPDQGLPGEGAQPKPA